MTTINTTPPSLNTGETYQGMATPGAGIPTKHVVVQANSITSPASGVTFAAAVTAAATAPTAGTYRLPDVSELQTAWNNNRTQFPGGVYWSGEVLPGGTTAKVVQFPEGTVSTLPVTALAGVIPVRAVGTF